eukprot:3999795-Lingulodinium_polyedra.AAC.1
MAQHPWLKKYADKEAAESQGQGSEEAGPSSKGPVAEAQSDEAILEAFARLEAKRAEWAATVPEKPTHFQVSIRGGAWSQANRGV